MIHETPIVKFSRQTYFELSMNHKKDMPFQVDFDYFQSNRSIEMWSLTTNDIIHSTYLKVTEKSDHLQSKEHGNNIISIISRSITINIYSNWCCDVLWNEPSLWTHNQYLPSMISVHLDIMIIYKYQDMSSI